MKTVPLGEVATVNPARVTLPPDEPVSFVGMAELDASTATAKTRQILPYSAVSKGYTPFRRGDVLAAKITPCWENGKVGQANITTAYGAGSTEFHVVRPSETIDERYLLHFLRRPQVNATGELRMTGSAGQRRVPASFLRSLEIPLPPLDEQRRIAAILDHAQTLVSRRQASISLHSMLSSSCIEQTLRSTSLETVEMSDLALNMRNGVSPSNGGGAKFKVLTLSAITGETFSPSFCKVGSFTKTPGSGKLVRKNELLVCRGNGNIELVGKSAISSQDFLDTVFPDTIIGITLDENKVKPMLLNYLWGRGFIRSQIRRSARTTNGTFKINQKAIGDVTVRLPPMDVQVRCEKIILDAQERMVAFLQSKAEFGALASALQARAFRGEL